MELLQLRYFLESAKCESFAAVAEKYKVPASSVSASVKRLETELGTPLFHRTANRITLSDEGAVFKAAVIKSFAEIDGAVEKITSQSTDGRQIRMLVRAMRGEITDRIINYKERHPAMAFRTVFDFDEKDIGAYDIIIDEASERYAEYESIKLFTSKVRLRAAKDSPLCGRTLTLRQLKNQPFVSIGENNGMHKILMQACEKAGFVPNIVVQTNDLACNRKCVEAGVGIGLAREYPGAYLSPGCSYLSVTDFNETQDVFAFFKKEALYGNVEHFIKFLQNNCK